MFIKQKGNRRKFLIIHSIGLAMAVAFFVVANAWSSRILPGVRIGKVAVGGLSMAGAEQKIRQTLAQRPIRLVYEEKFWRPDLTELGAEADVGSTVRRAYQVGRIGGFSFFGPNVLLGRPMPLQVSWDEKRLAEYLRLAASRIGEPPRDATVVVTDGQLAMVPEKDGVVIDAEDVKTEFTARLQGLDEPTVFIKPRIGEPMISQDDLENALTQAEGMLGQKLELRTREKSYNIDRAMIGQWLKFAASQPLTSTEVSTIAAIPRLRPSVTVGIDAAALTNYVTSIAREVDTAAEPQKLLRSKNKVEVMDEGRSGKIVAVAAAIELIRNAVQSGSGAPIELAMLEVPAPTVFLDAPSAPIPNGKVISVDLTKMMEYLYENGELAYTSKISPGINNWTPTGTFKIYAKTKKQKMSGPGYYLPNVPNILWFKGDYSIHGAYWHNDFGVRPRSHGCVGEPLVEAEWVFNWAEVGTPVVIYKS
ncbi:MAG: peptidoglycan binding domain-containing protein [Candidatus Kerfeldbacteria bacterium]|nr:peptidoglycan binding domain-containing protein [Candidatus Kerfeldbacteria bacterium]